MVKDVKIALIGCGAAGNGHCEAYKYLNNLGVETINLVAICDMVAERAEKCASSIKSWQGKEGR